MKVIPLVGIIGLTTTMAFANISKPFIDSGVEMFNGNNDPHKQYSKQMIGVGFHYLLDPRIDTTWGVELTDYRKGIDYKEYDTHYLVPRIGLTIDKHLSLSYKYENNDMGVKQNFYIKYEFE